VASGEPLTAMHYDALLKAAVWGQNHSAVLATLRAMHAEKIAVVPALAAQVQAFVHEAPAANSSAIRRAINALEQAEFTTPPAFAVVRQPPAPQRAIFDWPVVPQSASSNKKRRGNHGFKREAPSSASASASSNEESSASASSLPKKNA
jgi:hypothetical protein